jgi:SNF2 family DNA or RNA helicase
MYNGSPKEREPVLNDFKMGRLDVGTCMRSLNSDSSADRFGIVLTTFDLARRDIENLCDLAWTCVIVDEVHRVKNESSKITNAFHQFACPRRFGLTGTAIQNSYQELFTILDWTNPGRLGTSKQWRGYVSKPLTLGQSASATEEERVKGMASNITLLARGEAHRSIGRCQDFERQVVA